MAQSKGCSFLPHSNILTNWRFALIALLAVLFVSAANADRIVYSVDDTDPIPNAITGDSVSGDLELNAKDIDGAHSAIYYTGTVSDVSDAIKTNLFATGAWGTNDGGRVWLQGSTLYTGVTTVECYALIFKGNAGNAMITSAGFDGPGKVVFESLDQNGNRNIILNLTADSSKPQPHTGVLQINSQSRLYFSTDANLSNSTLKLNGGSSSANYTEASFNTASKNVSFKSVTCDNQDVRILNVNGGTSAETLNTISFQTGTFTGQLGRYTSGTDVPGGGTAFVNYFNLTKASDSTADGGTLTVSGPVYYKGATKIEGGTLEISNSDFVSTSSLTGSGTLKLSGNNRYFNIASSTASEFTGTIQLFDTSISGDSRIKLATATYSWKNKALQTTYSAANVSLPNAALIMNGNAADKCSEFAFQYSNSHFTIGTLNGNAYSRFLNLESTSDPTKYSTLTVSNGTYAGEIGRNRNSDNNTTAFVNYINLVKADDGTDNGGKLTLSNKYMYYKGTTTIEGGTLEFTNNLSGDAYQYFARSTALKGSGNLDFVGANWTVFSINTTDTTTAQEFSGTVNISGKIMLTKEGLDVARDLNLGNATINVESTGIIGLFGQKNTAVSNLTAKELNVESGGVIRICKYDPGSAFGTLTVGRGLISGTLGQENTVWNKVNLVKVSDGSDDGGTLTIDGQNYYVGSTTVSGGALILSGDAVVANGKMTVGANGTLEYNVADGQTKLTITSDNAISSTGTIKKTGDGTLQILTEAANMVEASSWVVSSGRMDMKEFFKGSLTIGEQLDSGDYTTATFSPGNSVGDLTITGDFTLSPGSTLLMEIGGTDAELNDQLIVNGDFSIANDAIIEIILAGNSNFTSGDNFTAQIIANTLNGSDPADGDVTSLFKDYLVPGWPFYDLSVTKEGNVYSIHGTYDPNAVPEPSTWALLVLSVVTLFLRKRVRS